jgi:glycosyltransferase involved in cell wall biosynthesis
MRVATLHTAIEFGGWLVFAIWGVVSGIPSLWMIGRTLRRKSEQLLEPSEWPFVSVVVPARDEGHKIEAGLKSLLASDYPRLEIIAIDDRSRDETGQVMDRLSAECAITSPLPLGEGIGRDVDDKPRLRVIHVTELPDGWLGKNHALQAGFEKANGEWLLFTDGDVVHDPQTLRRAMRFAIGRGIDHLPLYPDIVADGIFEAAFVTCFGLIFAAGTQPWLIPSRLPWFYAGVGAYNLVRRSALERANGFEPIRLDVMDDVKLGKLLKRTGSKCEVLRAGEALQIRWQQSAWACITGLEKNAFASANYSLPQLLWMMTVTTFVICGPIVGAILAGDARIGYVAAAVLSHVLYGLTASLFGHSFWLFPLLVPSGLAFVFAFLRSGWITLRQGGVRWRGTFYPLDLLRRQLYR